MTALQLNAQLYAQLALIGEDESLMTKLVNYAKKLTKSYMAKDDSLLTKEEFMAEIDESLRQVKNGEADAMLPGEDLSDFLKRMGYAV